MDRMISLCRLPLLTTFALHFALPLVCVYFPLPTLPVLLVPFSHCVKPVGRLFPLERGLGSVSHYRVRLFLSPPALTLPLLYAIPPSKPPDF